MKTKITKTLIESWQYTFDCAEGYEDEAMEDFLATLKREPKEPPVDAEAVVRCAECRYCYDIGQDPMEPYDGEDVWHCEMWDREVSAYQVDPYRFFCARGERRKAT